ncbi:ATP-grasp domain-containing protein [Cytobacillus firmus]|uniref:ATP-grasp domain-containing protein n=1 Tax=Cytobacillus firmus TaxID=1399 RepID=UPI0018CFA0B3|nr:ATP-grasp domain-containing protein [Cytobacillus firmus]MBG9590194.1 hypothetical protein [Cytobacillus firmus]
MNKRILIIGGKKAVLRKAKTLGLEVIYIQKSRSFSAEHLEYVDFCIVSDFNNTEKLIDIAKTIYSIIPFDYVISLSEFGLIPASVINDYFNLEGNSNFTVTLLKNKLMLREHLNNRNISKVAASKGISLSDIENFISENNYPIIVKPIDGEGSFGIFKINKSDNLLEKWHQIKRTGLNEFIIEEYLEGLEVSVECFTFNGRHEIIAVTEKLGYKNFVETGHVVPARLGKESLESVHRLIDTFLNSIDLKVGPSHTEIKFTPTGPKIIESHNRRGGGNINELVELAYGIDMEELALTYPILDKGYPQLNKKVIQGSMIRFVIPKPGIVEEIRGVDDIKEDGNLAIIHLNINVGDRVRELNWAQDRAGYMIVTGHDSNLAIDNCQRLYNKLLIKTSQGGVK